jgi:hypothetical protein
VSTTLITPLHVLGKIGRFINRESKLEKPKWVYGERDNFYKGVYLKCNISKQQVNNKREEGVKWLESLKTLR